MKYAMTEGLRGRLRVSGLVRLSEQQSIDVDETEFNRHVKQLTLNSKHFEGKSLSDHVMSIADIHDEAAKRCLAKNKAIAGEGSDVVKVDSVVTMTHELIGLQLSEIHERQQARDALELRDREHDASLKELSNLVKQSALNVALNVSGSVVELADSLMLKQEQAVSKIKDAIDTGTSTIVRDMGSYNQRQVFTADGLIAAHKQLGESIAANHEAVSRLLRWLAVTMFVLAGLLLFAAAAHAQNVNPAKVVAVCGNTTLTVGDRTFVTVDSSGNTCVAAGTAATSDNQKTETALIAKLVANMNLGLHGTFGALVGSEGDRLKVAVPRPPNPCQTELLGDTPISQTATTRNVIGLPGLRTVICAVRIIVGAAEITSEWEGSGTNCATSTIAHSGSATVANGESFAANGGYQSPVLPYVLQLGNDWCIAQSSSSRVSGKVWYVRIP